MQSSRRGGGRRRLSAVSNFPGDVQSREQRKFRSGPAAEPLPTSCPPRQGRGKEAQRCPPPAPPARLGTMGSRRKKFGVRGRGGGPSRALSFCLGTSSPRRLRETGWDEGGGGGLRLTSHPSKRRKCGGDAQRRGVPLGAAGGARRTGWQRRAVPSRLSGRLLLLLRGGGVSCGGGARRSRGQPEPGRRGVGAAPSATQRPRPGAHGEAGGEGAAGTSPRPPTLPTERVGRAPPYPPRTPQPPGGEERGGGEAAAALSAAFGSPRARGGPLLSVRGHAVLTASAPHRRFSGRGRSESSGKLTSRTDCHQVITANSAGFWKNKISSPTDEPAMPPKSRITSSGPILQFPKPRSSSRVRPQSRILQRQPCFMAAQHLAFAGGEQLSWSCY